MNKSERQDLVSYKISRAKETLVEIKSHIENKFWATAVNRLYYACFYAVSALLIDKEIESHTHSGTKQMFGFYFVKPGIIKSESGKFYSTIFNLRQTGDYDAFVSFEEDSVKAMLHDAINLINEIELVLLKQ